MLIPTWAKETQTAAAPFVGKKRLNYFSFPLVYIPYAIGMRFSREWRLAVCGRGLVVGKFYCFNEWSLILVLIVLVPGGSACHLGRICCAVALALHLVSAAALEESGPGFRRSKPGQ